jgi:branched-chain amino acid transport system permease protein
LSPDQIGQLLVTGITLGSIYALVGLGFVAVFSVTGIINFAQGEFVMLGALATVSLERAGWPLPAAAASAVLGVAAVGAALHALAIRPARRASIITLIIITLGAAVVLRGAALLGWGTDPYPLAPFTPGPPLFLGNLVVTRQSLWVLAITLVVLVALYLFFNRTMLGRALRACAVNPLAARLMGIAPQRMALLSFILSAALGAIGGVVIAPITYATYDMGLMLGLKGFVAAIMGGLTNLPGAVIGGLILGVLESLGTGVSSAYKDAVAFVILLAVLLLRPSGLLSRDVDRGGL